MIHKNDTAVAMFSALGEANRLLLFLLIIEESGKCDFDETHPVAKNTVSELARLLGIAQSTTSYHISRLQQAGLVRSRRKHTKTYLFPTHQGSEQFANISSIYARSLENDKKVYPALNQKKPIEQKQFTDLISYTSLHGYLVQGPTGLESNFGAVRYHLYPKSRTDLISIEANYTPVDGAVRLSHLERYTDLLAKDLAHLNKQMQAWLNK